MANLKDTTINDDGFLTLPSGADGVRPGSPAAGMLRFNTSSNNVEYYNGTYWLRATGLQGVGGDKQFVDDAGTPKAAHSFLSTGSSTFSIG